MKSADQLFEGPKLQKETMIWSVRLPQLVHSLTKWHFLSQDKCPSMSAKIFRMCPRELQRCPQHQQNAPESKRHPMNHALSGAPSMTQEYFFLSSSQIGKAFRISGPPTVQKQKQMDWTSLLKWTYCLGWTTYRNAIAYRENVLQVKTLLTIYNLAFTLPWTIDVIFSQKMSNCNSGVRDLFCADVNICKELTINPHKYGLLEAYQWTV